MRAADVLIVGGGIVGAACAREFARRGLSVAVLESQALGGGATAASMGHLLVTDDEDGSSAGEHALTRRSLQLWQDWLDASAGHAEQAEYQRCGTLWIASDDADMALAARKAAWLRERGLRAELLDAAELARAEPLLRSGLQGAMKLPDDGRVYPPKVVARWLDEARATLIRGEACALGPGATVRLHDGRQLWAALLVLAAGLSTQRWLPPGCLIAKKGQLAITQRYPGLVAHQLVELAYLKNAHLSDQDTVSFNIQPRPEGQLLIGSSRQPGRGDAALDMALLGRMLTHACSYVPELAQMQLLRAWTGLRPASADGLPLIGAHPVRRQVWVAAGHEGLGISTAPASAELLADLALGGEPRLDPTPFSPARFAT